MDPMFIGRLATELENVPKLGCSACSLSASRAESCDEARHHQLYLFACCHPHRSTPSLTTEEMALIAASLLGFSPHPLRVVDARSRPRRYMGDLGCCSRHLSAEEQHSGGYRLVPRPPPRPPCPQLGLALFVQAPPRLRAVEVASLASPDTLKAPNRHG